MPAENCFTGQRMKLGAVTAHTVLAAKRIHHAKAGVMAVVFVLFSGVAETDNQPVDGLGGRLVFLFLLQLLQGVLPGNPQHLSGVKWDLAFNTSASFITNTNWQAYSGESTLSYLTQALGLTVQNFVSAATGIAVLFALIRGFIKVKADGLGSFWVDITRIVIHILIPLNLVIAVCLVGGGVIQVLELGTSGLN